MATDRGKIGRLPANLRNAVNGMIRDNKPAEDIIAWLDARGVAGITPQNVSAWKAWGYQKWEARMQQLDEQSARREWARAMLQEARADGDDSASLTSDAASMQAADIIQTALDDFDPQLLRGLLAEKPDKFVEVVKALSSIRTRDQASVALQIKVRDARRLTDEARKSAEASGNTDLAKLAAEMDRVLGA
jgi:hypothetical protein